MHEWIRQNQGSRSGSHLETAQGVPGACNLCMLPSRDMPGDVSCNA